MCYVQALPQHPHLCMPAPICSQSIHLQSMAVLQTPTSAHECLMAIERQVEQRGQQVG